LTSRQTPGALVELPHRRTNRLWRRPAGAVTTAW
jgi:hypothetical protein